VIGVSATVPTASPVAGAAGAVSVVVGGVAVVLSSAKALDNVAGPKANAATVVSKAMRFIMTSLLTLKVGLNGQVLSRPAHKSNDPCQASFRQFLHIAVTIP
jgi:hypothetical protein